MGAVQCAIWQRDTVPGGVALCMPCELALWDNIFWPQSAQPFHLFFSGRNLDNEKHRFKT